MTDDKRDVHYLVVVAADGLVLVRRAPSPAPSPRGSGSSCLAYLGDDRVAKAQAAAAALALVIYAERAAPHAAGTEASR